MSRGEKDFHYSKNIISCKWYDYKPVLLLATNVVGMSRVTRVIRRTKSSSSKTLVSCPNIINICNNDMDSVDIMDKKRGTDRLDRKSKYSFYLKLFFDLIHVALVNSRPSKRKSHEPSMPRKVPTHMPEFQEK